MIKTESVEPNFLTRFESPARSALADAPVEKGGQGGGFDPHELLESAVATCLNIIVRKKAAQLKLPIERVSTTVSLDRTHPDTSTFGYSIEVVGTLSDAQRRQLMDAAETCPVSESLAKKIVFIHKKPANTA